MIGSLELPLQGGALECLREGKPSATDALLTYIQLFQENDETVLSLNGLKASR